MMSLSSGAYFGSHWTVSQCLRASMALRVSLLTWIGPLSSTSTTGFIARPSWLRTEQGVELLEVSDEVAHTCDSLVKLRESA